MQIMNPNLPRKIIFLHIQNHKYKKKGNLTIFLKIKHIEQNTRTK